MFPMCYRWKAVQGPHSSCLMTAETHWSYFPFRHSRWCQLLRCIRVYPYLFARYVDIAMYMGRFLLYFVLFVIAGGLSLLGYCSMKFSLWFQLRLAHFLIIIGHQPFEFRVLNTVMIYGVQVCMFSAGFLGYNAQSFIDS